MHSGRQMIFISQMDAVNNESEVGTLETRFVSTKYYRRKGLVWLFFIVSS